MDTPTHAAAGECLPTADPLIRLHDVPDVSWLPSRRGGAKLHVSTAWRWAMRGVRGHKLRTVRVGGTLCTQETWLRDFFEALADTAPGPDRAITRTPLRRQHEIAAAQKRLKEQGI
ncbi:MAG: DUF1580 domain-containing protein [Tepidisphaeraceae bacterium]